MRGFFGATERGFLKMDSRCPIWLDDKEMRENPQDTSEYLRRWRDGDGDALDALLRHIMPWIEQRVRRRLGQQLRAREETQDLVQQTLIDFLQYAPRVVIDDGQHLRALLGRIVENAIRGRHDHHSAQLRAMGREERWPGDSRHEPQRPQESRDRPSFAAQFDEQAALVHLGLELLDDESHDIISRRLWSKESFEQIGAALSISADACRMRFHRAVARLSGCVDKVRRGEIGQLLEDADEQEEEA
jgi:RNA polymerase sigma factor (sigma-70 family)